ncbi:MAG TPA: branched-chain amino acid ABC transporter permease [Actinomycetota bacterium]|nr:branched-chain amino acid ABC transporter permease [Actinomycetota bacterium]
MIIGEFALQALAPSIVNGVATGAFYAFIAIPLVLSFQVSRSVAFVHGGIATITGVVFWWVTSDFARFGTRPGFGRFIVQWRPIPALFLVVVLGGLLGLGYGAIVMFRLKHWPRVAVTTFSLGAMIASYGVVESLFSPDFPLPSPFGKGKYIILGQRVTYHQTATLVLVLSLSVALTLFLHRTKFGLYVRAIADDVGAAQIVGLPVERLAVAVWAISGAIAGLAGVCIVVFFRVTDLVVLTVFLQAIVVGILGGFNSLPLILLGSLVLGEVESIVGGGTFGTVSGANRELILMVLLFLTVAVVNAVRGSWVDLLEAN